MLIKVHLSGIAIAYPEPFSGKTEQFKGFSRPQGSLYGQQKRKIADAVEYMRRCGKNKPLIFVCTSPGFIERSHECRIISKFRDNLRTNYGLIDYVWVREFTGNGYPHFHWVADMPRVENPAKLSQYWSSFFDSAAKNSIRFGSKPDKDGRRKFFIESPKMAWYMSKYIGKRLSDDEKRNGVTMRTFHISQNAGKWSQPVTFCEVENLFNGQKTWQGWVADDDGEEHAVQFNPHTYQWKPCGEHSVFVGLPKSGIQKT